MRISLLLTRLGVRHFGIPRGAASARDVGKGPNLTKCESLKWASGGKRSLTHSTGRGVWPFRKTALRYNEIGLERTLEADGLDGKSQLYIKAN